MAQTISILYRFSRPHTVIGTVISIVSVSTVAYQVYQPVFSSFLNQVLWALSASFFANIAIVGTNELFDVEIDRINKPYLPLASGELAMNGGIFLVVSSLIFSVVIAMWSQSVPLQATVISSLILGFIYSYDSPLTRWKRYPVLAALCIFSVRALFVQLGFYYHIAQGTLQRPLQEIPLSKSIIFATSFMAFFSFVIALMKDLPDTEGDEQSGVRTFSVRQGRDRVFKICMVLVTLGYTVAIVTCLSLANKTKGMVAAGMHLICLVAAIYYSRKVDLKQSSSIYDYYMFTWKLFYFEYFMIPLIV